MKLIKNKAELDKFKRGLRGFPELEGFDGEFPFYAIVDSFNIYAGKCNVKWYSRSKLLELVNNIDQISVSNANGEK
ncbi:hypothetical protein N9043_00940 [bacterium]|nr:hypothetical protein [bacterium]